MSELRQAGQHPDADQLNAFVEKALPPHEQEQTLAHLATCPTCRQIIALALPPADESSVVAPTPVRQFLPMRLVWVAAPALAALIVLAIFLRRPETHTTTAPPQVADARHPAPTPSQEPEPALSTPPIAARRSAPRPTNQKQDLVAADRLQAVSPSSSAPSGVMGGILGGIGTGPPNPQAAQSARSPIPAALNGSVAFFPVANLLPSNLAILSMASHANQRVAIDADHQLFFSDDNGRHWQAIAAPWKGHAVRVAMASAGNAVVRLPMKSEFRHMGAQAAPLAATPTSANLSGNVTDATGASVQGATVAAIEFGSVVSSATSDSEGKFRIENLPPGSYRVEAQAPGFEKQSSVTEITPAHPATVDFTLQVGSMAQTVNVQSAAPALDTVLVAPAKPVLALFELTTDDGQHWVSDDGKIWRTK